MLGVFIIPDLISGDFELNTSVILYNLAVLAIGTVGTIIIVKKIVRKYGDSKKTYISYGIFFSLFTASMVGAQFIIRNYPGFVIAESNQTVNLIIGAILLSIFIIVPLIMKQGFLALFIFLICLPEIIAKIATGGSSPESESYVWISAIVFFVIAITAIGILIYTSKKEDKKTSN